MFIKKYEGNSNDRLYIGTGLGLYLITMIIGVLILTVAFKPLSTRYILPIIGVFWLSTSIMLDKINSKQLFTLALILILILGCLSLVKTVEKTPELYDEADNETKILNKLNNENNMIIYANNYYYACYHNDLNKTQEYSQRKLDWAFNEDYKIEKNISKIIDNNEDKNVYIIKSIKNKNDKNVYKNVSSQTYGRRGKIYFLKLDNNS